MLETYIDGKRIEGLKPKTETKLAEKVKMLNSDEAAVLSFLRDRLEKAT